MNPTSNMNPIAQESYLFKQQLDAAILELNALMASLTTSTQDLKSSTQSLQSNTTKVFAHFKTLETLAQSLDENIQSSVMNAAEIMGDKLANTTLEFIRTHLIDTMNGLNHEIKSTTHELQAVKSLHQTKTLRSSLKSYLIYGSRSLILSCMGSIIGVTLFMSWVVPGYQAYYEYGRIWKNAFDPLSKQDKQLIFDILKKKI